ncbi:MAG TPA: hypothetical protein VFE33_15800 [Thermoanaerobaculia bacterium]|nr:hypothetical protein [Thermoanaerobaculia bacterium]
MVELYWQSLARDVPFADYSTHPLVQRAGMAGATRRLEPAGEKLSSREDVAPATAADRIA